MPTYDFVCKECNTKFEQWSIISQKDSIECPNCSSNNLKQVFEGTISPPGSKKNCSSPELRDYS